MKANVKAFSLTCGICLGVGIFLMTWWVILFAGPTGVPTPIGAVFRGYTVSAVGSVIGLVWGLVAGAIAGSVLATVYNKLTPGAEKSSPTAA
ncbi:MAG TPA: hypothetical protein VJ417_05165 [Candidatus Glassbacteria bacterium]|nr:hypothetical protein [Candidatus Glassbacteria bacterium]